MTIEVQGPDGSIVEFPDGTGQDVMLRAMQQHFQPAAGSAPAAAGSPGSPPPGGNSGAAPVQAAPTPSPPQDHVGWMEGIGGSVASGISSDFADEIASKALGAMGDTSPEEDRLKMIRGRLKDFETQHPIVDFVGKAAGGMMSPLNKLGGGPILSGLISGAASGFGQGEDGIEDRVMGAGVGGLFGGALGAGLHLVGSAGRGLKNLVLGPDSERAGAALLTHTLERDGRNIDDIRAQITGSQAPLNVADTGRSTARLARTVESTPSEGSRILSDELTQRQQGAADRVSELIRGYVNPNSANKALKDLQDLRRIDARPAYKKAFAYGPVYNDRIVEMLGDPALKRGMKRGIEIEQTLARAEGRPFDLADYAITGFNAAGDPIMGPVPNMRLLDAAKKGLDDELEGFRNPITQRLDLNERGNSINRLRKSFVDEIDKLNPAYRSARDVYAGPSRSISAIRSGRDFLSGDLEDMEIRFNDLAPTDREFFVMGMARELRDMARNNISDTADATRKILGGKTRDRLKTFLGNDKYNEFVGHMLDEQRMSSTFNTTRGGSITIRGMQEQSDAAAQEQRALSFFADLASWGPKTAAANAIRRGYNRFQGMSEGTADWLAPRLLANDHDSLNLLERDLAKYSRQRERIRDISRRISTGLSGASTDALVR